MNNDELLLVGSQALKWWGHEVSCLDVDVIGNPPEGVKWDASPVSDLNNEEFITRYNSGFATLIDGVHVNICSLNGLAVLKRSHIFRDMNFDRHITHYHKHLAKYMREEDKEFCLERQRLTIEKYGRGNPNLKQSKEGFFNDAVKKKYDHDLLHELVAYPDRPMYTRLQKPGNEVWCEKSLWGELSFQNKLKCIGEEVSVINLERFIIPARVPYKLGHLKALRKCATTLMSGTWRDFCIDNYPALVDNYNPETITRVLNKLGEI